VLDLSLVRPEDTFGIPPGAEFTLSTGLLRSSDKKPGMSDARFLAEFPDFTLVLEYDGERYSRRFDRQAVEGEIARIRAALNPEETGMPRVTRRPNTKLGPLTPEVIVAQQDDRERY
jgi:hypothetical protein